MQQRILDEVETVKIWLDDDDWVGIKAKFTGMDRAKINGSTVEGGIFSREVEDELTGQKNTEIELGKLALGASNLATLYIAIVEWGGPGFCQVRHTDADQHQPGSAMCMVRPVNRQNINNLDDGTMRFLLDEIESRNPKPDKRASANPTIGHAPTS